MLEDRGKILKRRGVLPKKVWSYINNLLGVSDEAVLQDNAAHRSAISAKDMPTREFTWADIHGGYSMSYISIKYCHITVLLTLYYCNPRVILLYN